MDILKDNKTLIFFFLYLLFIFYDFVYIDSIRYEYTEWMISLNDSFRRGVTGSIIKFSYLISNLDIKVLIHLISVLILFYFFKEIYSKIKLNSSRLFLFSPLFFGYFIVSSNYLRKDVLCFLLLIFFLKNYKKGNIFSILLIFLSPLIHELFIFLVFPIIIIEITKKKFKIPVLYIISVLIVLTLSRVKLGIEPSWSEIKLKNIWSDVYSTSQGAFMFVNMNIFENILYTLKSDAYKFLLYPVIIFIIQYLFLNKYFKQITLLNKILLFNIIGFIPLFFLGVDYGRWIQYMVINTLVISLWLNQSEIRVTDTKYIFLTLLVPSTTIASFNSIFHFFYFSYLGRIGHYLLEKFSLVDNFKSLFS